MTGLFHRTGRLGFGHKAILWKAARPGPRSGTSPPPPEASAGRNHRLFRQPRRALTASAAALALATGAAAQQLPAGPGGFSLEQTMASRVQNEFFAPEEAGRALTGPQSGATSAIVQRGSNNRAGTASFDSRRSILSSVQSGQRNESAAVVQDSPEAGVAQAQLGLNDRLAGNDNRAAARILDSPRSSIAQYQIGNANASDVEIVRGRENTAATLQVGNGLETSLSLVDSVGTTVVYGQIGSNAGSASVDGVSAGLGATETGQWDVQPGSVTIRNAPPGTTVRFGDVTEEVRQ